MHTRSATSKRVSVFVVSEVRIYREGIASNLQQHSELEVVGTSATTLDTVRRLTPVCPDVIVLDVSSRHSVELVRSLRRELSSVKIIVFGIEESEEQILAYAESGVAGYVGCDASMNDLVTIIMNVIRGELVCSPRLAGTLFQHIGSLASGPPAADWRGVLTNRECEVLACLRASLSNKEIAQRLNIAEATVKNHVHSLLGKLQITKRTQALKATLPALPAGLSSGPGSRASASEPHGRPI